MAVIDEPDVAVDDFVAQLAARPDLVRRLLETHRATTDGWCRAHDAHRERHPCSIRRIAELAARTRG